MAQIVIGDNQIRVKDCYATSQQINLTLRSNGEEKVQVMDSLGQFVPAGLPAPTVAPTPAVVVVGAPGFEQPTWLAYRYVYAAQKRYPLIRNDVIYDGRQGPRSNPSPSASVNITVANRAVDLTVTKTTRIDIDEIWIFRTDFFLTQAEADEAALLGDMFYVGSIANDGNAGTAVYQDRELTVTGNPEIELDNFESQQFALCAYDPPYFYGYSNLPFEALITVAADGLVTLNNPWSLLNLTGDKWYDGRNSQKVVMEGITNGGSDNNGTYFFKWLTASTAQLCLDQALTQNGPVNYTGVTKIKIYGPATTIYRSKAHNPFSWGTFSLAGEEEIPAPYFHEVGGGQGTAICVVPVVNAMKVDTEGPNKSFIFNLKAKGSDEFQRSQQEISSDYSASNQWSQFPARNAEGVGLLWFLDNKYKVVCESDGTNNQDISGPIFDSIRNLSTVARDRLLSHGVYEPTLQICCLWVTRQLGLQTNDTVNDLCLIYHYPTNSWSTLYFREVLCSVPYRDSVTNEQMVLIGTETGIVGRAFVPGRFANWIKLPGSWPKYGTIIDDFNISYEGDVLTELAAENNMVGMWMTLVAHANGVPPESLTEGFLNGQVAGYARISAIVYDALNDVTVFTFDKFKDGQDQGTLEVLGDMAIPWDFYGALSFLECIVCNACKFVNLEKPFVPHKLNQITFTAKGISNPLFLGPDGFETFKSFKAAINIDIPSNTMLLQHGRLSVFQQDVMPYMSQDPTTPGSVSTWSTNTVVAIDAMKAFRINFFDVGYSPTQFYNYTLAIEQDGR